MIRVEFDFSHLAYENDIMLKFNDYDNVVIQGAHIDLLDDSNPHTMIMSFEDQPQYLEQALAPLTFITDSLGILCAGKKFFDNMVPPEQQQTVNTKFLGTFEFDGMEIIMHHCLNNEQMQIIRKLAGTSAAFLANSLLIE